MEPLIAQATKPVVIQSKECIGYGPFKNCATNTPASAGNVIGIIFQVIIIVAFFSSLFFALQGAMDYIRSSGEPQALAKAQNKMLYAFLGIIILVVLFVAYAGIICGLLKVCVGGGSILFSLPSFSK